MHVRSSPHERGNADVCRVWALCHQGIPGWQIRGTACEAPAAAPEARDRNVLAPPSPGTKTRLFVATDGSADLVIALEYMICLQIKFDCLRSTTICFDNRKKFW